LRRPFPHPNLPKPSSHTHHETAPQVAVEREAREEAVHSATAALLERARAAEAGLEAEKQRCKVVEERAAAAEAAAESAEVATHRAKAVTLEAELEAATSKIDAAEAEAALKAEREVGRQLAEGEINRQKAKAQELQTALLQEGEQLHAERTKARTLLRPPLNFLSRSLLNVKEPIESSNDFFIAGGGGGRVAARGGGAAGGELS
jgi:hypothetical protein